MVASVYIAHTMKQNMIWWL